MDRTIARLEGYLHMADFGTCAVDWPLMDQWEGDRQRTVAWVSLCQPERFYGSGDRQVAYRLDSGQCSANCTSERTITPLAPASRKGLAES